MLRKIDKIVLATALLIGVGGTLIWGIIYWDNPEMFSYSIVFTLFGVIIPILWALKQI